MYKIRVSQNGFSWIIDTAFTLEIAGVLNDYYISSDSWDSVEIVTEISILS